MPEPEYRSETMEEGIPDPRVEVGVYATSQQAFEHGLVALTMGFPFWLEPAGDAFRLLVEPPAAERVREQLACFDRENLDWPPRPIADHPAMRNVELVTPLLWALSVVVSFWAQGVWSAWSAWGVLDAQAVFARGETWRLVTALFLHGDVGHLVSNAVSGIFVFSAVLTTMGRRRGWWLLALAAVLGNLAVAAMNHSGEYRSIGASTAIFGAVGLLTGRALRVVLRANHPHRWRTLFVPFAAGSTVLALHGAGGQQVDVLAHVTGFGAGLMMGWIAGLK